MAVRYKIQAATGKYKGQDGSEKTRYVDVGVIMDGKQGGFVMKIECIPVGFDGWCYLNEPNKRPPTGGGATRRTPPPPSDGGGDFEEDIPFASAYKGRAWSAI